MVSELQDRSSTAEEYDRGKLLNQWYHDVQRKEMSQEHQYTFQIIP